MLIKRLFARVLFVACMVNIGCTPTLHIDGKFTVDHRVVHTVGRNSSELQNTSIRDLKAMGLVGERFDGYIGIVVPEVDDDILQKINQMNTERREQYNKIVAQVEDSTLHDIEHQAGSVFIEREKTGFYILAEGKEWQRK